MSSNKVVAIHQPTFFPWLGYFNKLARSDVFVVLDTVQYPKKGGTWGNRVKLLVNGQASWVTLPVDRNYHGVRTYREMSIDNSGNQRDKIIRTIRMNYAGCLFFGEVFPLIEPLIINPTTRLTDYNLSAILDLAQRLGIDTGKITLASELRTQGTGTDLLVAITKSLNGTAYLCGGGASGYQEDEKFGAAGLHLIYQNFKHPVYEQLNTSEFVPGLSIIDVLMNCGLERTADLIRSA